MLAAAAAGLRMEQQEQQVMAAAQVLTAGLLVLMELLTRVAGVAAAVLRERLEVMAALVALASLSFDMPTLLPPQHPPQVHPRLL
jgi:hypothetical protein